MVALMIGLACCSGAAALALLWCIGAVVKLRRDSQQDLVDLAVYWGGELHELRSMIEGGSSTGTANGRRWSVTHTGLLPCVRGHSADLASLRSLCEALCGDLGHDYREVERQAEHWDGDAFEPALVVVKCTRCGHERTYSPADWDALSKEQS